MSKKDYKAVKKYCKHQLKEDKKLCQKNFTVLAVSEIYHGVHEQIKIARVHRVPSNYTQQSISPENKKVDM